MIRYLTAGESHGPQLTAIVEGIPAGLSLSEDQINIDLARRQCGYGRGGRMLIEKDQVEILSGVRWGKTIGSPITLCIRNKDWENWQEKMSTAAHHRDDKIRVTRSRPGHADLAGYYKFGFSDLRNVLERASARETASSTERSGPSARTPNGKQAPIAAHTVRAATRRRAFGINGKFLISYPSS